MPTHRANLAKEPALFRRSSGHTLLLLDTLFQATHPTEGRTYNMKFCAIAGRRINHQPFITVVVYISVTFSNLAFEVIIWLFIFKHLRFGA
jgi:hypothetical protein